MSGETVTSWGRYPYHPQTPHPTFWRSDLAHDLAALRVAHGTTLPYGQGRSYGDSCMAASDHVLAMRNLNRFIEADWSRGTLRAEAGVTLAEILALAIPHGWFLAVTPGTQQVTLGGAIANDVHGKNHHVRGTFGRHVTQFSLLRSDRQEPLLCSPTQEAELFRATIGGLGLTGIISWAEIRLIPIRSSRITTQHIPFQTLEEFFGLCAEWDAKREYTVAWIDGLAKQPRGIFFHGAHAEEGELSVEARAEKQIPITPPLSLITPLSARLFNGAYYRAHKNAAQHNVDYASFFYPLDRVGQWNRIYGPRGLQQYQCVIPDAAARETIPLLLQRIAASGRASFLAVLKRCGDLASPGLLSFPLPGISLALDFAQHDALTHTVFPALDAIVRDAGGRLYPAKDAHMSAPDFQSSYPQWEQLGRLRDPALSSRFWQRVTL